MVILISSGILFILLLITLIFGTGRKTVCISKSDQSENVYTMKTKYVIISRGKNVSSVKITEVINSKKKEILDKFEKQLKSQY